MLNSFTILSSFSFTTMPTNRTDSTDHLDDAELLARESTDRDEFKRLEQAEPQFRDTTYGQVRGSSALVLSWERWWSTNAAARLRGLLTRTIGS